MDQKLKEYYDTQQAAFVGLASQAKAIKQEVIDIFAKQYENKEFLVKEDARSNMVSGKIVRVIKVVDALCYGEVVIMVAPYNKDGDTISGRVIKINVADLGEVQNG